MRHFFFFIMISAVVLVDKMTTVFAAGPLSEKDLRIIRSALNPHETGRVSPLAYYILSMRDSLNTGGVNPHSDELFDQIASDPVIHGYATQGQAQRILSIQRAWLQLQRDHQDLLSRELPKVILDEYIRYVSRSSQVQSPVDASSSESRNQWILEQRRRVNQYMRDFLRMMIREGFVLKRVLPSGRHSQACLEEEINDIDFNQEQLAGSLSELGGFLGIFSSGFLSIRSHSGSRYRLFSPKSPRQRTSILAQIFRNLLTGDILRLGMLGGPSFDELEKSLRDNIRTTNPNQFAVSESSSVDWQRRVQPFLNLAALFDESNSSLPDQVAISRVEGQFPRKLVQVFDEAKAWQNRLRAEPLRMSFMPTSQTSSNLDFETRSDQTQMSDFKIRLIQQMSDAEVPTRFHLVSEAEIKNPSSTIITEKEFSMRLDHREIFMIESERGLNSSVAGFSLLHPEGFQVSHIELKTELGQVLVYGRDYILACDPIHGFEFVRWIRPFHGTIFSTVWYQRRPAENSNDLLFQQSFSAQDALRLIDALRQGGFENLAVAFERRSHSNAGLVFSDVERIFRDESYYSTRSEDTLVRPASSAGPVGPFRMFAQFLGEGGHLYLQDEAMSKMMRTAFDLLFNGQRSPSFMVEERMCYERERGQFSLMNSQRVHLVAISQESSSSSRRTFFIEKLPTQKDSLSPNSLSEARVYRRETQRRRSLHRLRELQREVEGTFLRNHLRGSQPRDNLVERLLTVSELVDQLVESQQADLASMAHRLRDLYPDDSSFFDHNLEANLETRELFLAQIVEIVQEEMDHFNSHFQAFLVLNHSSEDNALIPHFKQLIHNLLDQMMLNVRDEISSIRLESVDQSETDSSPTSSPEVQNSRSSIGAWSNFMRKCSAALESWMRRQGS